MRATDTSHASAGEAPIVSTSEKTVALAYIAIFAAALVFIVIIARRLGELEHEVTAHLGALTGPQSEEPTERPPAV